MTKKIISLVLSAICLLALLSGCKGETTSAYYQSENNKLVRIDVTDKHDFYQHQGDPFTIVKRGNTYLTGTFAPSDVYEFYKYFVENNESATLIEEGEKDGFSYFLFSVDYIGVDTGTLGIDDLFSSLDGDAPDDTSELLDDADKPVVTEYNILVAFPEAEAVLALSSDRSEEDVRAAFRDMSFATEDADTE